MINVEVRLNKTVNDSYSIFIGKGITEFIFEQIKTQNLAYSYVIITDSNVKQLYGDILLKKMRLIFPRVELISFPAGEQNKNRETKSYLEDKMLELKFARDSAIIALGGGVVGDIAGFVAATYVRGLNYIQIPTSLVACVDSSIGGKTAVDTKHGKNLIGAFHQPKAVFINTDTLKTLNKKEINEGLAEVIKYGVIMDKNFFSYLEENIEEVHKHDDEVILNIIKTSCMIKAEVVKKDEKESNLRKILNFGHTIGHAIEQLSEYTISHGEAISRGMVLE
ncbi:MAG: 3-dehydroquinate synthase, partial [Thermodesulfobacteriota bacterium]